MIEIIKIEADLHTHSISSGHAYSTIDDLAQSAAEKNLKLIAITDHGPALPGGPHEYHFGNLVILPRVINGVRVLKGVEANILDDGQLDLPEQTLQKLDFVAAGLHTGTGHSLKTSEEYTEAVIMAMQNPHLRMITHPVNREFPLDLERIVRAAREQGVILEVNASSYHPLKGSWRGIEEEDIKLCRLARKYGVLLSLNSDAHYRTEIGQVDSLERIVRKAHLGNAEVINTSVGRLLNILGRTGGRKREIG